MHRWFARGEIGVAEVVPIQHETGVALGKVMGSEHRMDLWMLASPLVPCRIVAHENPQVFLPLPLARLELHGTVDLGARIVQWRLNGTALDRQPILDVALESKTPIELGHGRPPAVTENRN
jgi:hypothetical protein